MSDTADRTLFSDLSDLFSKKDEDEDAKEVRIEPSCGRPIHILALAPVLAMSLSLSLCGPPDPGPDPGPDPVKYGVGVRPLLDRSYLSILGGGGREWMGEGRLGFVS